MNQYNQNVRNALSEAENLIIGNRSLSLGGIVDFQDNKSFVFARQATPRREFSARFAVLKRPKTQHGLRVIWRFSREEFPESDANTCHLFLVILTANQITELLVSALELWNINAKKKVGDSIVAKQYRFNEQKQSLCMCVLNLVHFFVIEREMTKFKVLWRT